MCGERQESVLSPSCTALLHAERILPTLGRLARRPGAHFDQGGKTVELLQRCSLRLQQRLPKSSEAVAATEAIDPGGGLTRQPPLATLDQRARGTPNQVAKQQRRGGRPGGGALGQAALGVLWQGMWLLLWWLTARASSTSQRPDPPRATARQARSVRPAVRTVPAPSSVVARCQGRDHRRWRASWLAVPDKCGTVSRMPSSQPAPLITYFRYWLPFGLVLGALGGLQLVIASGRLSPGLLPLGFGLAIGAVGAPLKYEWDRRRGFPSPDRPADGLTTLLGLLCATAAVTSSFVRALDGPTWISLPMLATALLFAVLAWRRARRING